jgi:hypothetical protein
MKAELILFLRNNRSKWTTGICSVDSHVEHNNNPFIENNNNSEYKVLQCSYFHDGFAMEYVLLIY